MLACSRFNFKQSKESASIDITSILENQNGSNCASEYFQLVSAVEWLKCKCPFETMWNVLQEPRKIHIDHTKLVLFFLHVIEWIETSNHFLYFFLFFLFPLKHSDMLINFIQQEKKRFFHWSNSSKASKLIIWRSTKKNRQFQENIYEKDEGTIW
jgi:hypothetical protein